MQPKDISFIITVYNRLEKINEFSDSFVALNSDKKFEIVFVEGVIVENVKNVY